MKIQGESKLPAAQLAFLQRAVAALEDGAKFLEVGTYHGATAALLAAACPRVQVVSIDLFADRRVDPAYWFKNRQPNMALYVGTAQTFWALGFDGEFDAIFIDAMHTEAAILADLWAASRMLKPTGRLFCHDDDPVKWPGVVEGITKWCAKGAWKRGPRQDTLVELVRC